MMSATLIARPMIMPNQKESLCEWIYTCTKNHSRTLQYSDLRCSLFPCTPSPSRLGIRGDPLCGDKNKADKETGRQKRTLHTLHLRRGEKYLRSREEESVQIEFTFVSAAHRCYHGRMTVASERYAIYAATSAIRRMR
ncbi:hypothetical protein FVEG_15693 [Fusarium verticillioides 7600]|uniref:Uncharacterized protein n=1 Tax=Gibberella moniliformis (strain M3125 / FGSC 7600) TaxID=334819 RepID=W7MIG8_GIBM7|nr:hypothetical protein FVEG_15693 [Fusarium verticillioides 7600]EWG44652.1 hypothetical protein FVEG_15693 [Fusarium verticillioides 7600]